MMLNPDTTQDDETPATTHEEIKQQCWHVSTALKTLLPADVSYVLVLVGHVPSANGLHPTAARTNLAPAPLAEVLRGIVSELDSQIAAGTSIED